MVLFMWVYIELLVQMCYKCGVFVIGGMSVFILNCCDFGVMVCVVEKVLVDKKCEVGDGFDGIWVVYFDLIFMVQVEFDVVFGDCLNQVDCQCDDVYVEVCDLFDLYIGCLIIVQGVWDNVLVVICYFEVWLCGFGVVVIDNFMEDVVIVEISCLQVWQWIYQDCIMQDGIFIMVEYVEGLIGEVLGEVEWCEGDCFDDVVEIFCEVVFCEEFLIFFILGVYSWFLVDED